LFDWLSDFKRIKKKIEFEMYKIEKLRLSCGFKIIKKPKKKQGFLIKL
jgi:hypothetical protein